MLPGEKKRGDTWRCKGSHLENHWDGNREWKKVKLHEIYRFPDWQCCVSSIILVLQNELFANSGAIYIEPFTSQYLLAGRLSEHQQARLAVLLTTGAEKFYNNEEAREELWPFLMTSVQCLMTGPCWQAGGQVSRRCSSVVCSSSPGMWLKTESQLRGSLAGLGRNRCCWSLFSPRHQDW